MNQIDQKLRVGFLLLDNFTLNAFSGFIEALRLAADQGGRSQQIACGWQMMSQGRVTASCGLSVAATRYLSDPSEMDYLAVCGGNDYHSRTQPAWLDSYLRRAAEADTRLIGICTGTFNIARSGLMKNRPACVHWNVINEFRSQFPRIEVVADRIFIDAGDRITCAGSAGAADLALHLITRHCGREKALQSIRHMLLTGVRPSTHPQAHFKIQMESVADECVRRCVNLMEQALNDPPAIPYLAQEVGLSPRQLDRRFTKAVGKPPRSVLPRDAPALRKLVADSYHRHRCANRCRHRLFRCGAFPSRVSQTVWTISEAVPAVCIRIGS